jgi:hypothetical protein
MAEVQKPRRSAPSQGNPVPTASFPEANRQELIDRSSLVAGSKRRLDNQTLDLLTGMSVGTVSASVPDQTSL